MRLEITEDSIKLVPDTRMEIGWIKEVLGLKRGGDSLPCVFRGAMGFDDWLAYLEVAKPC